MTTEAAFSPDEWKVVLEAPPAAGLIVITAARGGTFRETIAMSKAYAEARAEHGDSELLDEIVAAKPQADHTRYHSAEELRDNGLRHLRDAVALVDTRAAKQQTESPGWRGDSGRLELVRGMALGRPSNPSLVPEKQVLTCEKLSRDGGI